MRRVFQACLGLAVAAMAGCGASSEAELRQWMAQQRQQTRPRITPIPEPKQFKPEPYLQATAIDPFSKDKLAQALKREASKSASGGALLGPELARRKEPLEAYPLDSMTMVGTLRKDGKPVALIRVDNLLYQVRLGAYVGQNYGRVGQITETQVILREIVQDAVGEWVERPATLQLQERSK